MEKKKDYFSIKSGEYEKDSKRVDNVNTIADAILKQIAYEKHMELIDFGSGTGLLTSQIAPFVKKITTVDISSSMNKILREKSHDFPCEIEILELDLSKETIARKVHGIISSMTVHHVENTLELFKKFHAMLHVGGSLAIADLDSEDGTFHKEDMGVFHFGFDQDLFLKTAQKAGFSELKIEIVSVAVKPYGEYPIFLLTGKK